MSTRLERIEIKGLKDGGFCCGNGTDATIKRSYPAILHHSNVSQVLWLGFCDQFDTTLKSIRPIKRQTSRAALIIFSLIGIAIICAPILITQTPIDKYLGRIWYAYVFGVIFIIPCIFFFRLKGNISRKMSKVFEELKFVCLNTSNQFSGVTFKFTTVRRTNGKKSWNDRYVDVEVDGFPVETDDNTVSTAGIVSLDEFIASPIRDGLTIDERLQELERMKPHLSDDEYNVRRQELMNEV